MTAKRILIIDDDDNIRNLLKLEFTESGYLAEVADSAFMGIERLKSDPFDLVVLDIKMPGMDGVEALEKIMSIRNEIPVIIHSAYSHFKENYRTWSAVSYIVKSGDLTELKNAIADAFN